MTDPAFPSARTLVRTWLWLVGLTLATMVAGKTLGEANRLASLGIAWAAALMLVTGLKARLILWRYLDLAASTPGWRGLLVAYLLAVLGIVLGLYIAAVVA
jgi:Prokaryotic Cytochrome C oxidase subunit IV